MKYDLFPTLIQVTDTTSVSLQELTNYCKTLQDKLSTLEISNIGGWQSPGLEKNHPVLNPLIKDILDKGEQYRKFIKYKYPLKMGKMWLNINKQKDYNLEHHHPNCFLSGVFYININGGEIMFKHPGWSSMEYDWPSTRFEQTTVHNSTLWKVLPKPNTLIIFPSWLVHSVLPNNSNEERITISFNLIDESSK